MTKPVFPQWARAEAAGQIVTPPDAKIGQGHNAGEPTAAEYMNWYQNAVGLWVRGLQHAYGDIVVGTAANKTAKVATHDYVLDDWVGAIVAGNTVVILAGTTVVLQQNEDITVDNVRIILEPGAVLDDGTSRTLTLSGNNITMQGGTLTGFGANAIALSGDGYINCSGLTSTNVNATGTWLVVSDGIIGVGSSFATGGTLVYKPGGFLYTNTTAIGNVGSGIDTLMSFTLPANTMDVDGQLLKIKIGGSRAGAQSKSIMFNFGATGFAVLPISTSTDRWTADIEIVRDSINTQTILLSAFDAGANIRTVITLSGETMGSSIVVKVTGQNNTDTVNDVVVQEFMSIVLYR